MKTFYPLLLGMAFFILMANSTTANASPITEKPVTVCSDFKTVVEDSYNVLVLNTTESMYRQTFTGKAMRADYFCQYRVYAKSSNRVSQGRFIINSEDGTYHLERIN